MYRHWKFASIPGVLALTLAACLDPEEQAPGTLKLTTSTRRLNAEGQTTTVYVTAVDENGEAGTGTVTLSARVGSLAGAGPDLELPLESGKASTTYACTRATTTGCLGSIPIRGTWNDVSGSTSVVILASDAGTSGGTDGGL